MLGAASGRRFSYKGKRFYVYSPSKPAGMPPINRWPLSKLARGPIRPSTLRFGFCNSFLLFFSLSFSYTNILYKSTAPSTEPMSNYGLRPKRKRLSQWSLCKECDVFGGTLRGVDSLHGIRFQDLDIEVLFNMGFIRVSLFSDD
ncbi:hypothetical protein NPIL_489911 [Nephila pilipes]|uniref:Uncharacterized protein n=1 Tax=Nephila pilipes TaxID=299642 RepID=A0A8X6QY60_NEPPI|nr:hypothetical protein NPIL_489911 [Nephila pilipes]